VPHLTAIRWYGPWNGWSQTFAYLSWDDFDPTVTTYQVWLEADPNPDVLIRTVPADGGSCPNGLCSIPDFTDITAGVTYCWYVSATNAVGTVEGNALCSAR
jgi:hypothetical protein